MHLPQGEMGGCFWENGTVCAEAQGPMITVQSVLQVPGQAEPFQEALEEGTGEANAHLPEGSQADRVI